METITLSPIIYQIPAIIKQRRKAMKSKSINFFQIKNLKKNIIIIHLSNRKIKSNTKNTYIKKINSLMRINHPDPTNELG
jgi:DNA polymerase III delta subunit